MTKPWLMGIDLGGSGVRCLLVDSVSGRRSESAVPWHFTAAAGTFGTGFDLDLDVLWRAAGKASQQALAGAGIAGEEIAGVAISAMRFSTVVIAKNGDCLLSVPNNDARAAGECFEIAEQWGEKLLKKTGSPALPLHASSRLLWLKNQEPDVFSDIECVYGFGEWLAERLSGRRAISPSQGSASGLLRLQEKVWASDIVDAMGIPQAILPEVIDSGVALGELTPEGAEHLGLTTQATLLMGGADTQCSLLGSGVTEAGESAFVAGTTAPVETVLEQPAIDPSGALLGAHHVVPGRWVLESNGGPMGYSISTMAKMLYTGSSAPEAQLLAEASQSEPGAGGMLSTFGADVMNMSAPTLPMGAITLSHMALADDEAPRRHMARAMAEGCACALDANLQQLARVLGTESPDNGAITLCGGLSRSDFFAQLVADITGAEVVTPDTHQTTALGAVMCAAVGTGIHDGFASASAAMSRQRKRFGPQADLAGTYASLKDVWTRLREGAAHATFPVAADHLLPKILQEPDAPAAGHAPAEKRPEALVSASFGEDSLQALGEKMGVEYASFREAKRLLTGPGLVEALADKQVFVTEVDVLDAAALKELPDLRVVAACRGDAVNVDVEACTAFGIPVLFAPGRNAIAVADLAVGFMLNLARKLPQASSFLEQEDCTAGNMGKMGQAFNQFQGNELWKKTVGLIGLGAVGRAVARRLAGFEVEILVADPFVTPEQATLSGCQLTDLDTLLEKSDFVSLHAAVTPQTTGMLGAAEFARMKPSAFFINTARAALVEEQALIDALQSERIAGAALDTFAVEPPGFDHPLVQHHNVIATPHSAGNTREVAIHQGDTVSRALIQLMEGARPGNVLNPEVLEDFSWEGPRRQPEEAELKKLSEKSGPAVSDLQRDAKASKKETADAGQINAPDEVVEKMREILQLFCAGMAEDSAIVAFSEDTNVTLHFNVHDLGLEFYITLDGGEVDSALGAPEHGAEVQLEMRGQILDGMFTGTIDTMECAMNGEISFMGDAAKAMTLQHMNSDMERLYRAAREQVGDPGDLGAIPTAGEASAAPAVIGSDDVREDLVEIMQELYESQVITATGGNISVRIPDTEDELWITPSRLFKGDLHPEVLVRINLKGESLDRGARSPSSEWCMHTRILEVKPEATAVIHAHAPNATILANSGLPFLPISTEAAFFGNIPRIPFTMPGTPELANVVAEAMEDEWAALLINHGLIVGGRTLRRAADMVEIIERSAEIILGCHAVGKEPPVLPEDAAAHFRKLGDVVA